MILSESDKRFLLKRMLQSLSRSTLRDLAGSDEARERGLSMGVGEMLTALGKRQIFLPEGADMDFRSMDRMGKG